MNEHSAAMDGGTILIAGATGTVGRHVVARFAEAGLQVRALARDPRRAAGLLPKRVTIATGDFGVQTTLDAAMEGIDRVFLVCGNGPLQQEHERAVINAAERAGVRLTVKISSIVATSDPTHFHSQLETVLENSSMQYIHLRPAAYMQSFLTLIEDDVTKNGVIRLPGADGYVYYIDVRDVADAAFCALVEPGHENRGYVIRGTDALTFADVARSLSEALGRPVGYRNIPPEEAQALWEEAGLPEFMVDVLDMVFASIRESTREVIADDLELLTGRSPRSWKVFARDMLVTRSAPTEWRDLRLRTAKAGRS